jgi:hypothetical protein
MPFMHLNAALVGLGRLELPTPRLSSVCSNQLSYRPVRLRSFKTKQLDSKCWI